MKIDNEISIPFYIKVTIFIVGLFTLVWILYIAQSIIIPIIFAVIIAIVLHPVVNILVRFKINRVVAIIIALFFTFVIVASVAVLLVNQASHFSETWPILVDKLTEMLNQSISWASNYFDINPRKIHEWIKNTRIELINTNTALIGQTIMSLGSGLVVLLLVPVYVFMIIYYEPLILDFIRKLFGKSNQTKVSGIVTQTKTLIQSYLVGLIIEAAIIAALYTIALLSLGIEYAVLLAIIGALINVIPYVGGLVGVALPMIVAIATKSSAWYAIYVLIIYYFIQLIDNNYIVPKIVASKVKINALFSIMVVIAGNALWGISGMFLAIPLLAIVKLICDQIGPLKPWGFLLGDTMPPLLKIKPFSIKINKRIYDKS